MKKRRIVIIYILIAGFFSSADGQSLSSNTFKTLNVANGLPQSFISGLIQDSTGFIWIGTRDGLARYDGRVFKIFRHVPGDTLTLANNTIVNLYLDRKNRLWIVYETGDLDLLNTQSEQLIHLTHNFLYHPVYRLVKIAHSIEEDKDGNVWLLCNNGGLFICNPDKQLAHFYSDTILGFSQNKIVGMSSYKGRIVLVTDTAIVTLNENRSILQSIPFTFNRPHIYDPAVTWKDTHPIFRNNGDIVIHDQKRVLLYNSTSKSFTVFSLPNENLFNYSIVQDKHGQVYFDNMQDIYVLTTDNKLLMWKPKKENPAFGFKSMLIDNSGVLWLGSNGSGIQLIDLKLSRFQGRDYQSNFIEDMLTNYLSVPGAEIRQTFLHDLQAYHFRSLKADNNKIWFAKADNVLLTQAKVCYYQNGRLIQPAWHYADTMKANHAYINTLACSQSGKLWGIDFFMRPVYFDTLTNTVTVLPSIGYADTTYPYTANSLFIDGENKFWVSTCLNGLFYYNKETNKTVHYVSSDADGALPTNQLMTIVQDHFYTNILWIASLGGGLIKFDKTTGRCKFYTVREGLPNNTVYAIIADNNGILWCSSNKGIFSFDPKAGYVRQSFTSKDGLPGDEYNRYHYFTLLDGNIAFGGLDGYVVFNPLTVANDKFQPEVALTNININNAPADYGYKGSPFVAAINSLEEIRLPYTQDFLTFYFAALEYNIAEKLQYRYMLEGFNDKWINAGYDNVAVYTKIPSGRYTLKINATNTAGEWSSHIKTLVVIIEPPFWKTWWFMTLEILAIIGTIYVLVQFRISKVRKEERQKVQFEKEASELKAQALRAQMNPHFVFNCLNSIKALIQEDNKQQAVIYLTTFSKLIRNQLDNAQREISLHEELETCKLYTQLEALRFGSKIICEFEIENGLDTHSIQVPPLILQPFIENSIWHGILPKNGGKVTISVKAYEEYIQCSIDDDGIGREASMHNKSQVSATYQSKGLKLVQGRLNLHNIINNQGGTIEITDKKDSHGKSSGTLVLVKFKREA